MHRSAIRKSVFWERALPDKRHWPVSLSVAVPVSVAVAVAVSVAVAVAVTNISVAQHVAPVGAGYRLAVRAAGARG